jgi:hypothetical protein
VGNTFEQKKKRNRRTKEEKRKTKDKRIYEFGLILFLS